MSFVRPGTRAPKTFSLVGTECSISMNGPVAHLTFEPNSVSNFTLKVEGLTRFEGAQWSTGEVQGWWTESKEGDKRVLVFNEKGLAAIHEGGRLVLIDVFL